MENTEKNLPLPDEQPDNNFNDPEFDAAISKHLQDALESHDAVPDEGGARFLTVEITLAEYRQLVRDSQRASDADSRYWELYNRLSTENQKLKAENDRLTDTHKTETEEKHNGQ